MKCHLHSGDQAMGCKTQWNYDICVVVTTHETSWIYIGGATGVTLQHHQTLPLPRKQNSHDWSSSHMKLPAQCAEHQEPPSNFTKYCPCHGQLHSWLILVTHETSSTTRGATGVTLQHHRTLRLPRKWPSWLVLVTHVTSSATRGASEVTLQHHQVLLLLPRTMTLMIDPCHTWNVQYNARGIRSHPPTSPNIAPATKNYSHDWSSSHMKLPVQCLRGASGVTLQLHPILCLPRKITLMIDPRHTWNFQYNARSNRSRPPTSPCAPSSWLIAWTWMWYFSTQKMELNMLEHIPLLDLSLPVFKIKKDHANVHMFLWMSSRMISVQVQIEARLWQRRHHRITLQGLVPRPAKAKVVRDLFRWGKVWDLRLPKNSMVGWYLYLYCKWIISYSK